MFTSKFELGQIVSFVLNPLKKGQVVSVTFYVSGGMSYKVTYLDDAEKLVESECYESELESIE